MIISDPRCNVFIDEHRFLGLVGAERRRKALMLWDTSSMNAPGVELEFEPTVIPTLAVCPRNYESNHKLPFCEDPSRGIVGLTISNAGDIDCLMIVVPVKALVSVSREFESKVPWGKVDAACDGTFLTIPSLRSPFSGGAYDVATGEKCMGDPDTCRLRLLVPPYGKTRRRDGTDEPGGSGREWRKTWPTRPCVI